MTTQTTGSGKAVKWYLKPLAILVAILAVGPFAIPLVWMCPSFKKWHKVLITILVIFVTVAAIKESLKIYNALMNQIRDLQNTLN